MKRKMSIDQILILVVLALAGFGLVMVFSASTLISKELYGSSTTIFMKQLFSVGVGFILLIATMRIDYHLYENKYLVVLSVILACGLLGWALLSPGVKDVHRWILVGPIRFQPSEAAKIVVITLTAFFLARHNGRVKTVDRETLHYGGSVLVILLLILAGPDFGTTTSLAVTCGLLLFIAGLNLRYYLVLLVLSVPAFYFLVYSVPYRRERILAFLDPHADPYGSGYQIIQSLVAVGSGGVSGKGLAQGTQKLFFLPEPHTDFIYAVMGEELGLAGCVTVLLLFLVFLWRGIQISLRADSVFGTYLGLGIVTMISFQAFFNMSVVLGLLPTKGIPLPFISVGGSSAMVMLAAIGVLLNISRQSRSEVIVQAGSQLMQGEA